jgi:hypothetical protein
MNSGVPRIPGGIEFNPTRIDACERARSGFYKRHRTPVCHSKAGGNRGNRSKTCQHFLQLPFFKYLTRHRSYLPYFQRVRDPFKGFRYSFDVLFQHDFSSLRFELKDKKFA